MQHRHHILESASDQPKLAVSSSQLPANPTIVPGIPVRNIPQQQQQRPHHNSNNTHA